MFQSITSSALKGRTNRERDRKFKTSAREQSFWYAEALDGMQKDGAGAWRKKKKGRPRPKG